MSMTLYEANRFQPDICKSLTTEWLGEMMKGSHYGKLWCTHANGITLIRHSWNALNKFSR
ncbi:hypothetical protein [Vibrio coralliilyticus]|uniref:hypothetical protein n=1 Tax=Vibrio coralliilyticus TaxID=190893 RepID=UPI0020A53F73|nr:hypothetical protein [Vibrio coralliilyticus]